MTTYIRRTTLASIGAGSRVLTPDGLSPRIAGVRWCDGSGSIAVIRWEDGTQVEAAGAQQVHAVDDHHVRVVTPDHLAVSPRPIWTGNFPEEILRRAWAAHIVGDLRAVLALLGPLAVAGPRRRHDVWATVATGKALYAFTLANAGRLEQAIPLCDQLAAGWRERDAEAHTPAAIRFRLASPLPTQSVKLSLQETLHRWVLATAHRLPSAKHKGAHYRELARLRRVDNGKTPGPKERPMPTAQP